MAGSMFADKKEVTPISKAILNNDIQELKRELLNGEDPLFIDRKHNTYLHYVCTMHRPVIFHIIVGTGIDLNAQNRHGNSALHVTVLHSECCHVGDLMATGIDSNLKNKDGLTAAEISPKNAHWKIIYEKYKPGIYEAIAEYDVDRVLYLLHCWSRVDTKRDGQTLRQFAASRKFHDIVFHVDTLRHTLGAVYAVLADDTEKAQTFLLHPKCNVNFVNYATQSSHILQYAISHRNLKIIKMICRSNVNVSMPVAVRGYLKAPVFFEVLDSCVSEDIMWTVLKAGADFSCTDERGRNAAIYALDKTNRKIPLDVIMYMLENGLDICQRDSTGVTLRDVARFARRRDILTLLDKAYVKLIRTYDVAELERLCVQGYDSMIINFNYRDSFIYASGNETEDVVNFIQWLPKFCAQVRKFHAAVRYWSIDSIANVLNGCDRPELLINARDKGGRTACHLCVLHWRFDVFKLLSTQHNIDINARDNLGRTAFHYACSIEEEDERNKLCVLLLDAGINTEIKDHFYRKAEENIGSLKASLWLKKEKKIIYGMVKQLACADKYEELCHMLKYKRKTLKHFNMAVCRFKYPVSKFAHILPPLMPEYRDLLFVAMDYGKEDIAVRLLQLGTDWTKREMCPVPANPYNEDKTEETSQLVSGQERARQLGMNKLLMGIEKIIENLLQQKKVKQNTKSENNDLSRSCACVYKSRRSFETDNENGSLQYPCWDEYGDVNFEEDVLESDVEDYENDDGEFENHGDQDNVSSWESEERGVDLGSINNGKRDGEKDGDLDDVDTYSYSDGSCSSGYQDDGCGPDLPE